MPELFYSFANSFSLRPWFETSSSKCALGKQNIVRTTLLKQTHGQVYQPQLGWYLNRIVLLGGGCWFDVLPMSFSKVNLVGCCWKLNRQLDRCLVWSSKEVCRFKRMGWENIYLLSPLEHLGKIYETVLNWNVLNWNCDFVVALLFHSCLVFPSYLTMGNVLA